MKVAAGICALVLIIRGFANLFGGIQTVFNIFSYYFDFIIMLEGLLRSLTGVAYLATAVILVFFILRKAKEATNPLFAGLCATSVLGAAFIVVNLLLTFLYQIINGYFYFYTAPLVGVLGLIVVLALIFCTLWMSGDAPFAGYDPNQILAELQNLPQAMSEIIGRFTGDMKQRNADMQARRQQQYSQQAGSAGPRYAGNGAQPGGQTPPRTAPQPNPAAGNGQYQQGQVPPIRLRTDRSLLMYILLSIVTCGIYSWFFIYQLVRDVNIACAGDGQKTAGLIKLILLSIVTCGIYTYIWYYSLGNRLQQNAPRYGMMFPENGTTVLMWMLFGAFLCGIGPFVAMHIIFKNTNAICAAYNASNMDV